MSDDPTKRGPADRLRVNLSQKWEVSYWTRRFGCSVAALRAAVKRAGPMVVNVRRRLYYLRTGR